MNLDESEVSQAVCLNFTKQAVDPEWDEILNMSRILRARQTRPAHA